MSLRYDIINYTDVNGYVCSKPIDTHKGRQADNSTMFLSEYHIMLNKNHQDNEHDADNWEALIRKSEAAPGVTVRYPGDISEDAPDNILGILSAAQVLGKHNVANDIVNHGIKHFGCFNPENLNSIKTKDGSKINWKTFQWRQIQLYCAAKTAARRITYMNETLSLFMLAFVLGCNHIAPGHSFYSFSFLSMFLLYMDIPAIFYTALVILVAGLRNINTDNTDPKRLTWHLIQATAPCSLLCKLASKVWFWKLKKDYGQAQMKAVAAYYYYPQGLDNNPFSKYWISE